MEYDESLLLYSFKILQFISRLQFDESAFKFYGWMGEGEGAGMPNINGF